MEPQGSHQVSAPHTNSSLAGWPPLHFHPKWKAQDLPPPNLAPILQPNPEMFAPFQMWELLQATRPIKSRKAPGPDAIPGERWRFLPDPVKQIMLKHVNDCFLGGCAPQHWKLAKVIMLFKGGTKNSRPPSSYRPISVENTIYRLYATLLHQMLTSALEPHLSPQQFGFRRNRSMGSPLFIIRRLLEILERHTLHYIFVFFLDWSQAFGCVSHPQLRAALHRYSVPEPFVNAIMSIHQGSNFYAKDARLVPIYSLLSFLLSCTTFTNTLNFFFKANYGHFPKVPQKCISRWSGGRGQMVVLQPFVPLGKNWHGAWSIPPGPPVGWWRILKKYCYLRCFWPAAAETFDFYSVFSIFLNVGWWRSLTKTLLCAAFFARCW